MKHKIVIGCDHAGFELKDKIVNYLNKLGYIVNDLGTDSSSEAVDYPDYAKLVGHEISTGNAAYGILICGTGIGMSISANRLPRVRAALCYETTLAGLARKHNDANVLVLGSRVIAFKKATWIIDEFLNTDFEIRHQNRVTKIEMEKNLNDK